MRERKDALLIVDVQNDFCPGGALAVQNGDKIIPNINRIQPLFDTIIATKDWHPSNHISFAVNHPGKFIHDVIEVNGISQVLWPIHCVSGSTGSEFHPDLQIDRFKIILHKGMNPIMDSYSAFLENDQKTSTGLAGYLSSIGVTRIFLCGLATDYCVLYSAMDALKFGFETNVVLDACSGVNVPDGNIENALRNMRSHGIHIISTSDLLPAR